MRGEKEQNNSAKSPLKITKISPSWNNAAENIAFDSSSFPPPIISICGFSNSDKSIFSRILLNTLFKRYKRVAYLDLDVAQPEFTAAGCVSLHIIDKQILDLGILYIKKPERCIFFGHASAKKGAKTYFSSIIFLYNYFRQKFYQIDDIDNPCKTLLPLIINTSGWVKGNGYDMLVAILRHTSPTHVVNVCISSESKNLPNGLFWLEKTQRKSVNLVQICSGNETSYLPEIMRKEAFILQDIKIIAYFRQCLPREMNFLNHKEFVDKLASIPPNAIPFSRVHVRHNGCKVAISEGLNASIVGLAVRSSALDDEDSMPWCVGLGIIIGMNSSENHIYVLTPASQSSLKKVDLIIKSSIDIPICLKEAIACKSPDKVLRKQKLADWQG